MSATTSLPTAVAGRFGAYGGRYVPETLMAALEELEHAYDVAKEDPGFQAELDDLLHNYCGRPTPLYFAKRLTEQQRAGAGVVGPTHGETEDHRGDRRGAARSCDGHGVCVVRAGMRDLYGRRRHAEAGA